MKFIFFILIGINLNLYGNFDREFYEETREMETSLDKLGKDKAEIFGIKRKIKK